MKITNWPVEADPRNVDNTCMYCGAKEGEQHNQGCVCRRRSIVMKMEMNIVMEVPENWEVSTCEFNKNDGTWCASNIIQDLQKIDKDLGWLCGMVNFKYLREAMQEDEENQKFTFDK